MKVELSRWECEYIKAVITENVYGITKYFGDREKDVPESLDEGMKNLLSLKQKMMDVLDYMEEPHMEKIDEYYSRRSCSFEHLDDREEDVNTV